MTGPDGRQGRSFIFAGLLELGLDHPDRLLEGEQFPRDDGLTQGRPDRLQFINESVSAALIQLEAIRSVVQADNGLRDQWVVVSHPAHPRRRRAETPPPSSRISAAPRVRGRLNTRTTSPHRLEMRAPPTAQPSAGLCCHSSAVVAKRLGRHRRQVS